MLRGKITAVEIEEAIAVVAFFCYPLILFKRMVEKSGGDVDKV